MHTIGTRNYQQNLNQTYIKNLIVNNYKGYQLSGTLFIIAKVSINKLCNYFIFANFL